MIELLKLWNGLGAPVKSVVLAIIRAVSSSPNPYDAAKRAAEEAARDVAFDEAMRKALPGKDKP